NKDTPLHLAITAYKKSKNAEILNFLLANGADPSAQTKRGYNALMLSILLNQVELVQKLLDFNTEKKEMEEVLKIVGEEKEPSAQPNAKQLENRQTTEAEKPQMIDDKLQQQHHHPNPFFSMPQKDDFVLQKPSLFPKKSSRKKHQLMETESRNTELHFAVWHGSIEVIRLLVKNGPHVTSFFFPSKKKKQKTKMIDINIRDHHGYTPLHKAVDRGSLPLVQFLVENGARVDMSGLDGLAPIHIAALKNDYSILEFLLNHQADPNDITQDNRKPVDLTTDENCKVLLQQFMEKANQADLLTLEMSRDEKRNGVIKSILSCLKFCFLHFTFFCNRNKSNQKLKQLIHISVNIICTKLVRAFKKDCSKKNYFQLLHFAKKR
ncbi:ankyrin repeat protein, partial [Reticulomyxa filosa]